MKYIVESQLELYKKSSSDISSTKTQNTISKESLVLGDNKPTKIIEKTLTINEE